MGLLDRYFYVRITSAEPEKLLTNITNTGVEAWDITQTDLLTIELKVQRNQLRGVQTLTRKSGGTCRIIKKEGALWQAGEMLKRPVLLLGIILFFFLSFYIPERIFFITVSGNQTIPDNLILSQAEECGIKFGVKASSVRSEDMKNKMLGNLPQLQWIGVTTSGSVATIQIKERSTKEEPEEKENRVCSIVAVRDGTITEQAVYRGNPLFQVGQTVNAGDILISGYTDCGIMLKAEQASGEVFAYTLRQNSFAAPIPTAVRQMQTGTHTCYKLHIGKKVINLCNHSGILDTGCVKIYSEEYLALPGGFQLPVSIMKVEHLYYEQGKPQPLTVESFQWMSQYASDYLKTQMIAGEILNVDLQWQLLDGVCLLTGDYACHEMIGQVKYEENLVQNAEDN